MMFSVFNSVAPACVALTAPLPALFGWCARMSEIKTVIEIKIRLRAVPEVFRFCATCIRGNYRRALGNVIEIIVERIAPDFEKVLFNLGLHLSIERVLFGKFFGPFHAERLFWRPAKPAGELFEWVHGRSNASRIRNHTITARFANRNPKNQSSASSRSFFMVSNRIERPGWDRTRARQACRPDAAW